MVNVRKLIGEQKKFYKNIGIIYCGVLGADIYFSSRGFHHLLYKNNHEPRNISEIVLKLSCLQYVPPVIKNAKKITETRIITANSDDKKFNIYHYELVTKQEGGKMIRVVLEKRGNSKIHFLSTMPHCKSSKKPLRAKLNTRVSA